MFCTDVSASACSCAELRLPQHLSSPAEHVFMDRVWGGGIFYPDAFYDACDEYGVLVYHDMQCLPRTLYSYCVHRHSHT